MNADTEINPKKTDLRIVQGPPVLRADNSYLANWFKRIPVSRDARGGTSGPRCRTAGTYLFYVRKVTRRALEALRKF